MNDVDVYINQFPPPTKKFLEQVRVIIKKAAPNAEEIISYGMPAYKQNSVLVYFAGYKNHVGFYPTPSGIAAFQEKFKKYKWSKGAVQFPLDKPIPAALVTSIVKFRIKENLLKKSKKDKSNG